MLPLSIYLKKTQKYILQVIFALHHVQVNVSCFADEDSRAKRSDPHVLLSVSLIDFLSFLVLKVNPGLSAQGQTWIVQQTGHSVST